MTFRVRRSVRAGIGAVALTGMLVGPAQAQFGGLIPRDVRNVVDDAAETDACGNKKKSSAGSRVLGGIFGRTTRKVARDSGVSSWVPVGEFSDQISSEIACKLDPEEQKLAAEATLRATRSAVLESEEDEAGVDARPQVGSSASWKSETRDDVRGTSTVTARQTPEGSELDCITVTDVIIVEGEETKANKRMCRAPGSRRYAIIA